MFSRALFIITMLVALALAGSVVFSPLLETRADGTSRIFQLFAHDLTVRRTALAGAAGLLATAFVFFRSKKPSKPS